jgi:hypothetical protein
MARIAWVFTDLVTAETYSLPINPNDGGSPSYKKNIVYQNTAAPDGNVLMFEGRDDPKTSSFKGVLLTEDQYNTFVEWFEKRHQIQITDDLGRTFVCYITSFDPTRRRSAIHPWKHEYTCEYTIIDWAD